MTLGLVLAPATDGWCRLIFVLGALQFLLDDVGGGSLAFPLILITGAYTARSDVSPAVVTLSKKNPCLKGCKPHFDDDKLPTKFHNTVSAARTCCHDLTFASLEHVVRNCAVDGEQTQRDRVQNFYKAWVCHH